MWLRNHLGLGLLVIGHTHTLHLRWLSCLCLFMRLEMTLPLSSESWLLDHRHCGTMCDSGSGVWSPGLQKCVNMHDWYCFSNICPNLESTGHMSFPGTSFSYFLLDAYFFLILCFLSNGTILSIYWKNIQKLRKLNKKLIHQVTMFKYTCYLSFYLMNHLKVRQTQESMCTLSVLAWIFLERCSDFIEPQ